MEIPVIYAVIACFLSIAMTWGVGANDLANVMSTSMGSKAISVKQAIVIAIIFEIAGAFLGGTGVTNTLREGIININVLAPTPEIFIFGMLAVLFSGTVWILLASFIGVPVSITNAIVGGMIGFGTLVLGTHAVHWEQVKWIALSWVCSPVAAGIAAYILFRSIQALILANDNPPQKARLFAPVYFCLVGIVLAVMIVIKGLKHFSIHLKPLINLGLVAIFALLITLIGLLIIDFFPKENLHDRRHQFDYVEKIFALLVSLTACAMVFAHGSNDVSIAIGPMVAVISVVKLGGIMLQTPTFPGWATLLGCIGVLAGLFMYGRKVIATVGSGITTLTPSRAFAATLSAASTVIVSTSIGIPVSATQTLVGAVFGVGLARGIGALDLNVIRNILLSWIITIPAASILAVIFYELLHWVFTR